MVRAAVVALGLGLASCAPQDNTDQLNRIEQSLKRLESKRAPPQLPAPTTKEQYEQIPGGTIFLAPDGTIRKKPTSK